MGTQEGVARMRQTGWASEAGLLGQDMMSKLGDSVCCYPNEVTEGIKEDESNFACPSFLSLKLTAWRRDTPSGPKCYLYLWCHSGLKLWSHLSE